MRSAADERDAFSSLRRFVQRRKLNSERCELCSAEIGERHRHLFELKNRKVVCSCEACTILFSSNTGSHYRAVPTAIRYLPDFAITDAQWDSLAIPIHMAFFCDTSESGKPMAWYPSPAGAMQSLLELSSWHEIVGSNRLLAEMQPDVEALLVNRVTHPAEHYIVPIDECYTLVGLIRTKWRGLSGGTEVWQSIGSFFVSLKQRASRARDKRHV